MSARESQLTGRLRLRHLLEVTEAANEEMIEERPRFTALAKRSSSASLVARSNRPPASVDSIEPFGPSTPAVKLS
jgi:hypothetical protein